MPRLPGSHGSKAGSAFPRYRYPVVFARSGAICNSPAACRICLKGCVPDAAEITVAWAIRAYLADRRAEGQDTARIECQFNAHVVPTWGAVRLKDLTVPALRAWRDELVATPPRVRQAARSGQRPRHADVDLTDPDVRRRRRSSVNRITAAFKAALTFAAQLYPDEAPDPGIWREGLRAFRSVDAARERWLTHDEARRLVAACEVGFGRLVAAALYTGCRYGELCRAKVRDFDQAGRRLSIARTKAGRPRDVLLSAEGAAFFADLVHGREATELMLTRPVRRGRGSGAAPWGHTHQVKPLRRACRAAGIDPPINFHCLRHTYASLAVQSGMALIALARNLGHADTRMVERHYGHLSDRYLLEQVAAHTLSLRSRE
jgi:integrase